jgi:hypothetical protein
LSGVFIFVRRFMQSVVRPEAVGGLLFNPSNGQLPGAALLTSRGAGACRTFRLNRSAHTQGHGRHRLAAVRGVVRAQLFQRLPKFFSFSAGTVVAVQDAVRADIDRTQLTDQAAGASVTVSAASWPDMFSTVFAFDQQQHAGRVYNLDEHRVCGNTAGRHIALTTRFPGVQLQPAPCDPAAVPYSICHGRTANEWVGVRAVTAPAPLKF